MNKLSYFGAALGLLVSLPFFTFAATPPTITTTSLPDGAYGTSVSIPITATDGVPPYVWSAAGLPNGVSINSSTGVISGTPIGSGGIVASTTYTPTIQVQDAANEVATVQLNWNISSSYSYTRTPSGAGPLPNPVTARITGVYGADLCPNATNGSSYSIKSTTNGGFTQNLVERPVPGEYVDHTFTYTVVGTYVQLQLNCSSGPGGGLLEGGFSGTPIFTIASIPTITTNTTLPLAITGEPYSKTLEYSLSTHPLGQTFPQPPYVWSIVSGSLPDGLSLDATTGIISGVPTTSATSPATFSIQVQDAVGQTSTVAFSLLVTEVVPISLNITPLGDVAFGTTVDTSPVSITGGVPPFVWSATGLPSEVSIDPSTGVISGVPTLPSSANFAYGTTTYTPIIQVQDAIGQLASTTLSWNVSSSFTYARTPDGVGPLPNPISLHVTGIYGRDLCPGSGQGTLFSLRAYVNPGGALFNQTSYFPSLGEHIDVTYTFEGIGPYGSVELVCSKTGNRGFLEGNFTSSNLFTVGSLPTITTNPLLPLATTGTAYTATLQYQLAEHPFNHQTYPQPPYVWSITSGSLPNGLSLNAMTGVISGTPSATASTETFTVQIQDAIGQTNTEGLTIPMLGYTAAGTNIGVEPNTTDASGNPISPSPVSLEFSNVTDDGITSVQVKSGGAPPPSGFKVGNPPTYYSITTTASFSGNVEVCIDYTGVSYGNENNLKLSHYDSATGVWTEVTTSLDTTNNVICGLASSFSDFAVFEQKTVNELLSELHTFVYSLNLARGITNSLDAKLNAVQQAITDVNQHNDVAAYNALEAFKSSVSTQSSNGNITATDAQTLTSKANQIEALLQ